MMLYTTYKSSGPCSFRELVVSEKKGFENCLLKTYFWPRDLLMQPTETVWTTLVEKHIGFIPVKFGRNPISGLRGEYV